MARGSDTTDAAARSIQKQLNTNRHFVLRSSNLPQFTMYSGHDSNREERFVLWLSKMYDAHQHSISQSPIIGKLPITAFRFRCPSPRPGPMEQRPCCAAFFGMRQHFSLSFSSALLANLIWREFVHTLCVHQNLLSRHLFAAAAGGCCRPSAPFVRPVRSSVSHDEHNNVSSIQTHPNTRMHV